MRIQKPELQGPFMIKVVECDNQGLEDFLNGAIHGLMFSLPVLALWQVVP